MFKGIHAHEWSVWAAVLLFFLTSGVFLFIVYRSIRMTRQSVARMAGMPLDEASPETETTHE